MNESQYYKNLSEKKKKRRRKVYIRRAIFAFVMLVIIGLIAWGCIALFGGSDTDDEPETAPTVEVLDTVPAATGDEEFSSAESESQTVNTATSAELNTVLQEAVLLTAMYDYDGAIELIKSVPGYENDASAMAAIADAEAVKATCIPVDVEKVPHIFYHSLIVEADRCFDKSRYGSLVDGYNAWMVTVDEFNKVTQQLYDNGYVYVMLSDLYVEKTGDDGTIHIEKNNEMLLPPDKKAIVVSFDDLAYYAQYPDGFAQKVVFDENGVLKCEYSDKNGNVLVGDYDWLPLLDSFINEHPDASYKGAKGTIALTGYDGVFGYRTDEGFFSNPTSDEAAWIAKHPDVKLEDEIEQAKIIAQAIKDDGWEFASHSWGHRPMNEKSLDWLHQDTEKWLDRVEPIVGKTDILIYPHGADIEGLNDYSSSNEKYAYLKSRGFRIFCNVDASALYWNQFRDDYVRQARIDIDGYTLYLALSNDNTVISKLGIDAGSVFSDSRPTPVVANGAG